VKIYIIDELCNGCKICFKKCNYGAIDIIDHKAKINSNCTYCGICVDACPKRAIILEIVEGKIEDTRGDIWVYLETSEDKVIESSLELLSCARELKIDEASKVCGIFIGNSIGREEIRRVAQAGAQKLIKIQNSVFRNYDVFKYSKSLEWLTRQKKPSVFLFPATEIGRDIAPSLATILETGLTADCTELSIDLKTGLLVQTRPAFGGDLMASIVCPNGRPQMATVRPHSYKVRNFEVENFEEEEANLTVQFKINSNENLKIIEKKPVESKFPKIDEQKIIIAVGRGIGNEENLKLAYSFAKSVGAGIACSRPIVDKGWLPHELQVGLSGKTIAPKIYIALGISGSIQHIVGMQSSEYIIAVNRDENAPIFRVAHLGIVGDLKRVLPEMSKLLSRMNSSNN